MKLDITLKVTPEMMKDAQGNQKIALSGHLGTHFDVMNKEFPLDYTQRQGIVFDVSEIEGRDIEVSDIAVEKVKKEMFVAFCSGFIEKETYGTKKYFKEHPQLSHELIEALIDKKISIIGIDFAGIRRGKEHTPADQLCADNDVFVVENLCNLKKIIVVNEYFVARTYPISFTGMSGLPCRVVAEMDI
ncbi:MAG: cyclase family protein [Erysipelotrichaceae bacterium]|nr:cyclase family protein [Erysipelotrichaceae bacterium]